MNNTKQNDWFLNILANPAFSVGDFQQIGLNGDNTSFESREFYKNSLAITSNPKFQTDGKFDEVKFNNFYDKALYSYNNLTDDTYNEDIVKQTVFSKENIYAPEDAMKFDKPQVMVVKEPNPYRQKQGVYKVGQLHKQERSVQEIAQTQKVKDIITGELKSAPNDSFFDDFWDVRVLARYEEDGYHTDPITGERVKHEKGQLKLNDEGTFYYETLGNRDIYGKEVLSKFDILTTDGSVWNKYDFFDSDDLDKSLTGTVAKQVASIVPMLLPGVSPIYVGVGIAKEFGKVMSTVGKMVFGSDSPTLSKMEGFLNSLDFNTSEYAKEHPWALENIINMTADVFKQLYEQRWLFKNAPALFKGTLGTKTQAERDKVVAQWADDFKKLKTESIEKLDLDELLKQSVTDNVVSTFNATSKMQQYMKDYNKLGSIMSKIYMTGITTADAYGQAKQEGASDLQAMFLTLGYSAAEYALLSTGLGEWILPELRVDKQHMQQIVKVLSNYQETKDKLKFAQAAMKLGKDLFNASYSTKKGIKAVAANALGEGIEESTEELLYDLSKSMFNAISWLSGSDTNLTAWDDMGTRYSLSFVGGLIGGGLFQGTRPFKDLKNISNMTYNQAYQELVYLLREGKIDKFLNTMDKMTIGRKNLSATKGEYDKNGIFIGYAQGTTEDNQDKANKDAIKRLINSMSTILKTNGGIVSDSKLLNTQIMEDLRFKSLLNSSVARRYLQDYNSIDTAIIDISKKMLNYQSEFKRTHNITDEQLSHDEALKQEVNKGIAELNSQLQNLILKKQGYLNGSRAPEFIGEALFEMSTAINAPYIDSTFIRFAEATTNKKYSEISKTELEELGKQYKYWVETSKKDDVHLQYQTFNGINKLISKNIKSIIDQYQQTQKDPNLKQLESSIYNFINNPINAGDSLEFIQSAQAIQQSEIGELLKLVSTTFGNNNFKQRVLDIQQSYPDEASRNLALMELYENTTNDLLSGLVDKYKRQGYIDITLRDSLKKLINDKLEQTVNRLNEEFLDESEEVQLIDTDNRLHKEFDVIDKLPNSPIFQVLDNFGLSIKSDLNISKLLQTLSDQFQAYYNDITSFSVTEELQESIKEANLMLDMVMSLIQAMRTDNINISNPFGYNAILNSITNSDTYGILPSEVADQLTVDLLNIKNRLSFFDNLVRINTGLVLNEQDKTKVNKDVLIYNKLSKLIIAIPNDWDKQELVDTINKLELLKDVSSTNNLVLSVDDKVKLQNEMTQLEDAIYNFFQKNKNKLDEGKLSEIINSSNFNLLDRNISILNSDTNSLNDIQFIWYLATKAAVKTSSFYQEYKECISSDIAPIPIQEMCTNTLYASILNHKMFQTFSNTIKNGLVELSKNPPENESLIVWNAILDSEFSPRFDAITFIEGVAGAGKTVVIKTCIDMLKKHHPQYLNNVWVGHITTEKAEKYSKNIGIKEASTFDRDSLMKTVSNWTDIIENGQVKIDNSQYFLGENNVVHSSSSIKEIDNPPSLLIIDEFTHYSVLDADILQNFSNKYGIPIITTGDFDQDKLTGTHVIKYKDGSETKNVLQLSRFNFLTGFKLGVEMRPNNNLKAGNNNQIRAALPDLLTGRPAPITLHYNITDGEFYGDRIFGESQLGELDKVLDTMIQGLSENDKIGFIYEDTISPVYKHLMNSKYWDKILPIQGNTAQGDESKYFITDLTSIKSIGPLCSRLYTGMTRAIQGSIIVYDQENEHIYGIAQQEDDYVTFNSLSGQAISDYSSKRKDIIEKSLQGFQIQSVQEVKRIKDNSIITKQEQDKGPEVPPATLIPNSEGDIVIPNKGKLQSEKELKEQINNSNTDKLDQVNNSNLSELVSYIYSFNTLQTGWIKQEDGTYVKGKGTERIDGFYGLQKLFGFGDILSEEQSKQYIKILSYLSHTAITEKSIGQIVDKFRNILNIDDSHVVGGSFAYKSTTDFTDKGQYSKFYKDRINEQVEGIYSTDSNAKTPTAKSLVFVLQIDGKYSFELPILTLPSHISLVQTIPGLAQKLKNINIGTIDGILQAIKELDGTEFQTYADYLKIISFNSNGIFFIDDQDWTPANNLQNVGPVIVTKNKGLEYITGGYEYNGEWIDLQQAANTPGVNMSDIYMMVSDYNFNGVRYQVAKPGNPFVLISYNQNYSKEELMDAYLHQITDENAEQEIKLVYVSPPKVSFETYIENIKNLITTKSAKQIGNDFTSYRILSLLINSGALDRIKNDEGIKGMVNAQFGSETFIDKISNIVKHLDSLEGDTEAQFRYLKEVSDTGRQNQQILQKFLFSIVYDRQVNSGNYIMRDQYVQLIQTLLNNNGIEGIFYTVGFDHTKTNALYGVAKTDGNWGIDGIPFQINGLPESNMFNGDISQIFKYILPKIIRDEKTNIVRSSDNHKYINGQKVQSENKKPEVNLTINASSSIQGEISKIINDEKFTNIDDYVSLQQLLLKHNIILLDFDNKYYAGKIVEEINPGQIKYLEALPLQASNVSYLKEFLLTLDNNQKYNLSVDIQNKKWELYRIDESTTPVLSLDYDGLLEYIKNDELLSGQFNINLESTVEDLQSSIESAKLNPIQAITIGALIDSEISDIGLSDIKDKLNKLKDYINQESSQDNSCKISLKINI